MYSNICKNIEGLHFLLYKYVITIDCALEPTDQQMCVCTKFLFKEKI